MSIQAPSAVVLIRPHYFEPNPATTADNTFQSPVPSGRSDTIAACAQQEVTDVAAALVEHGVTVHLFDDEQPGRPDSVFPNNWFSTHSGGHIALFPMQSPSRRGERRADVVELLKRDYRVQDVIDYSGLEYDDVFLEGTGAMVRDHVSRVAYTVRSARADPVALERFCTNFGYEPMAFDAVDEAGRPVYHTNVLMCIATDFAMIGSAFIADQRRRAQILERLAAPGRRIIDLGLMQRRRRPHPGDLLAGACEPGCDTAGDYRRQRHHRPALRADYRAGRRLRPLHDRRRAPRSAAGCRALLSLSTQRDPVSGEWGTR